MNLRQYFQNVSFLFIINLLIKPIWVFGIERKFQLWLGQDAYGMYFSFLSLMYIIHVTLDLGLHSYSVKLISEKGSDYKSYISELWMSKLILVLLFLILVVVIILTQKLSLQHSILFFLTAMEMLTFSMFQFLRCFSQGLQKFKLDSLLSILDRVLLILFGGALLFLYYGHSTISLSSFILFHILAYILCFLFVGYYLRKEISYTLDSFNFSQLKRIVQDGYPLILVIILMSIYTRIDAVLLQKLLPDGNFQCGILAFSNRIIDSAYNALSLLSVFLLPTVAKNYLNKPYLQRLVLFSFLLCTLITIVFIGICYHYSHLIYAILYHTSDANSIEVFKTQLWTVLGVGWMYIFGSYLTGIGKFVQLIGIVSVGVLLSLSLNLLWIPKLGVLGAAKASAIVQVTMGILHLLVAFYYLYQKETE